MGWKKYLEVSEAIGCLVVGMIFSSFQDVVCEESQDFVMMEKETSETAKVEQISPRIRVTQKGDDVVIKIIGVDADDSSEKKQEKKHKKVSSVCEERSVFSPDPWTKIQRIALGVDFLYFQPTEDGLIYARTNHDTAYPMKAVQQPFSYEPGARVVTAFPVHYERWKINAQYTYFAAHPETAHAKSSNPTDPLTYLFALPGSGIYSPIDASQAIRSVVGSWDLTMNAVDVSLGKPFQVEKLLIEPEIGVKAAQVNQVVHVAYEYRIGDTAYELDFFRSLVGRSMFRGIGPEAVLKLRYVMPKKFSLFFRGAYSYLWGVFDLATKMNDLGLTTIRHQLFKEKDTRLSSVIELQLGLSKTFVYGKKQYKWIEVTAGWEMQSWGDQMRILWLATLNPETPPSALNLSGPFAKLAMSF